MARLYCQVCAEPAHRTDDGVLWLLPETVTANTDWPHTLLVVEPPVCVSCARLAVRVCPALSRGRHVLVRAESYPVYGVNGLLYREGPHGPVLVDERAVLPHGDTGARWMLASKLVRELIDITVLDGGDIGH
jgi:hypothetical protein